MAHLGTIYALTQLDNEFIDGFISGVSQTGAASLPTIVQVHINADRLGYMNGVNRGFLSGLWTGLESLVDTVIEVFRLNALSSLVLPALVQEAHLLLTNEAHRELRRFQVAQAQALRSRVEEVLRDLSQHPHDYLALSRETGQALGQHFGTLAARDLSSRNAARLGELAGSIAGQIAFEVILELLLALATRGVGNAARVEVALGQGSRGAARLTALARRLKPILMERPGFRRLLSLIEDTRGVGIIWRRFGRGIRVCETSPGVVTIRINVQQYGDAGRHWRRALGGPNHGGFGRIFLQREGSTVRRRWHTAGPRADYSGPGEGMALNPDEAPGAAMIWEAERPPSVEMVDAIHNQALGRDIGNALRQFPQNHPNDLWELVFEFH